MRKDLVYRKYIYIAFYITLMQSNRDLVQILGALLLFEILKDLASTLRVSL